MADPLRTPGVWLDAYRRDLKTALSIAAQSGFSSVASNTVHNELTPAEFSTSARRHLRRYLRDLGLRMDACALEHGGLGLADAAAGEQRLRQLDELLTLCRDIDAPHVAVAVGGLGDPAVQGLALEALAQTAELADQRGVLVSIRTGQPAAAAAALRDLRCPWLRLEVDSAALLGTPELDPVLREAGLISLRDARRSGQALREVDLGTGEVDVPGLLRRLGEAGRPPPILLRREEAANPVDAQRAAREYVASLLTGR